MKKEFSKKDLKNIKCYQDGNFTFSPDILDKIMADQTVDLDDVIEILNNICKKTRLAIIDKNNNIIAWQTKLNDYEWDL